MEIRETTLATRRQRLAGRTTAAFAAMAGLTLVMLAFAGSALAAQPPVGLGTTASYGVLAGTTVTNTGPTVVNGDLGLSPGSAVTGFPPGTVFGGVQHVADANAVQAQSDLVTAYDDIAGRTPATAVPGDNLGGQTLVAGVYGGGALDLTGTLTLDAQGDPGAVFIFQAASTLITASASKVALINGARPCNVFWKVGSSATLGTTTAFTGTIIALTSIGLNTGATVDGRLLARNGAVTLDDNIIKTPDCSPVGPPASTPTTIVTHVHDPGHADVTDKSVAVGKAVHDSSTVTGASPTGTVTYRFYASGNGTCTGASTSQTVAVGKESSPQTLGIGSYAYSADYSGDANNEPSSGVCEPFKITDTVLPICTWSSDGATVQDKGSGLASVTVVSAVNATVQLPSIASGTKATVLVPTPVVNASLASNVTLSIKDLAGNVKLCDPITLKMRSRGKAGLRSRTFRVPRAESKLQIMNGPRGLSRIDVVVNGRTLRFKLRPGQHLRVSLASAMRPGRANKVKFIAYGRKGAGATVLLTD